jgi:hypothetical protein
MIAAVQWCAASPIDPDQSQAAGRRPNIGSTMIVEAF